MINFSRQQHIFSQIVLLAIIVSNIIFLQSSIIGIIFGLFYLWLNSKKLTDIIAPHIHQGMKNIIGLLSILAYVAIVYTISYHLYLINLWVFLFVLISIPLIIEVLSLTRNVQHYFLNGLNFDFLKIQKIRSHFLNFLFLALDIIILVALYKKASVGIIRSPWELLGFKFWIVFGLSNLFLITSLIDKKSHKNVFTLTCHFFLLASIAVILYPLGYGYDSFIHNAALKNIASTGTIEPRLFLYVGQYGLSFFIHQLTQISLVTANKILLPAMFALLWPSSLYYGLKYGFSWNFKSAYLATLWALFIGFSFAIMTTPQSLSFLLAAIFIFLLPEINRHRISLHFPLTISLMTISIHPLTGVPLLFFTALLFIWRQPKNILTRIIKIILYIGASVSLPALFAIYQKLSGLSWQNIFNFKLWPLFEISSPTWLATYSFPLDMLYNLEENKLWIYTLIVLLGLYSIIREKKFIFFKRLIIFTGILILNYLLTSIFLSFNLQIDYQKADYINRISYLIAIFVLPIFLTALYFLFQHTLKGKSLTKKLFVVILTLIIVLVGTYFSYPVYDRHGNSKSFNVTATDIKTVNLIAEDAQNQDYIVLANQMVGAAAIDQYGFSHYYNDNFYYSMPLGNNNIYQDFIAMIESEASREQALIAMDKAGVDKLYFVVNNYWHSAKTAIWQAENTADEKILVDNGVNTVFIYNR